MGLIQMEQDRIAQIEKELWLMEYKEHWTSADWVRRAQLNAELNKLKNK